MFGTPYSIWLDNDKEAFRSLTKDILRVQIITTIIFFGWIVSQMICQRGKFKGNKYY